HVLGATFHVPHGRAVALFLPYTIEFMGREAPDRFADLARFVGCSTEVGEGGARALAGYIRELTRQIGNPTQMSEVGLQRAAFEAQLNKLVDDAFNDTQMVTACRSPSYEELARLFLAAYDGQPVYF